MSASISRAPAAVSMSAVARSEDVGLFCPDAPLLAPGRDVFVLYSADGTPIFVTDSHESAVANAANEELEASCVIVKVAVPSRF